MTPGEGEMAAADGATVLTLACPAPFDWPAMLGFFARRAVDGIETVTGDAYARTVEIDGRPGLLEVRPDDGGLVATVHVSGPVAATDAAARLRRMFGLDADLAEIGAALGRDPVLARLIAAKPAFRVPGHWEPFETAMRAVLGQQVSLAAARRLAARLVERAGGPAPGGRRLFPSPAQVLGADLSAMGMPGSRASTLKAVAEAAAADPALFRRGATLDETVGRLRAIRGVGPWTAHYVAIRACREPDGFPASDVGLLRGAARLDGRRPTPAELERRAEAWRPWRAFAAHLLWSADDAETAAPG